MRVSFLMSTHPSFKGHWVLHLRMSLDILGAQNTESGTQAPGQPYLMEKYHIGVNLASSGLSFYLLGFATGPLICMYYCYYTRRSSDWLWIFAGGN